MCMQINDPLASFAHASGRGLVCSSYALPISKADTYVGSKIKKKEFLPYGRLAPCK